ncbi:MAG: hypothetical protein H0T71_04555 [Acidobacteria bacterium]|nr:hypothetical protein [Acidobacteriota bacterium]
MLDSKLPHRHSDMVWFYERQGNFIRCDTRDAAGRATAFELLIIQPDGSENVEHFEDSPSLERRRRELEAALTHEGWAGPFGGTI